MFCKKDGGRMRDVGPHGINLLLSCLIEPLRRRQKLVQFLVRSLGT